ncbi:MAG TPA: hypothetical protein VK578_03240 [Edaphobacter sp.]|nr:hypothetical protein [Edaphobacter sp.]
MPSIYQLTPPLLAMNAHRIESPLSNHPIDYERDAKFFAEYPHRQTLIREAGMGEFDLDMPCDEWLQVPRLWCLVMQVSAGVHSVVPVYRGRKFWSFIKDDAALGIVLTDIARREGIDAQEWQGVRASSRSQEQTSSIERK